MLICRWLGVAGLEFTLQDYTLLVDPFFTRPPRRDLLNGARVPANAALAALHAPRADAVLITHPHYDHILDVPGILRRTGAPAYGSPNACRLLALHGIPAAQAVRVTPGMHLQLGPFTVEVFPADHARIPLARWFNGPLPRHLRPDAPPDSVRLPLRLTDYRMDTCFSYRIRCQTAAGERTMLVGNHPAPADVLFIAPYHPGNKVESVLRGVAPRQVAPIHWDDFSRPLDLPLLPALLTTAQGLPPGFPPVRRLDPGSFIRQVSAILPAASVRFPELFGEIDVE